MFSSTYQLRPTLPRRRRRRLSANAGVSLASQSRTASWLNTTPWEHVLPGRLFEGAAGGAIILGTAPQCPEFNDCFDWDGAVVEVSPDGSDIVAVIEELDTRHDWTERLRETNATGCLMKHDWVYRWEHILSTIGLDPLPRLWQRKSRLAEIAGAAINKVPA
jgi:hypothetical protein